MTVSVKSRVNPPSLSVTLPIFIGSRGLMPKSGIPLAKYGTAFCEDASRQALSLHTHLSMKGTVERIIFNRLLFITPINKIPIIYSIIFGTTRTTPSLTK